MMSAPPRHRPTQSARSFSTNSAHAKPVLQQPASLAKRLLFPHLTTNDLPLLLSTPSAPAELTAELYDFIALALRAFVNPWWTKITRYDKEFLPEITRILTVLVRALETRVLAADLCPLLFRDIPILVTQHYKDYRNASSKLSTSYASGGSISLQQLFHGLQPHMAVSPEGRIDPEYLRQIADHILKSCLPKEDYEPEAERFVIREIILKVVLEDVVPKITQPWFISMLLLDLLEPPKSNAQIQLTDGSSLPPTRPASPSTTSPTFSFHNLLVIVLSGIQTVSGFCLLLAHAYKQARNTIKLVNESGPRFRPPSPRHSSSDSQLPRSPSPAPTDVQSHPPIPSLSPSLSAASSSSSLPITSSAHPAVRYSQSDDLALQPLFMLSEIFTLSTRTASNMIMNTLLMLTTLFMTFLDRLLPYALNQLLSPQFVVNTVRTAKRTLFPNGYPVPSPPDPTPEEQAIMRERLVSWKPKGVPGHLLHLILGSDSSATIGDALDPLSDAACNVHLFVLILDRVIVSLFPELGGVSDEPVITGRSESR